MDGSPIHFEKLFHKKLFFLLNLGFIYGILLAYA